MPLHFASLIPIDSLFSTQGIMVMLLGAYALAMWLFLTSAPKVYTVMVSDLAIAKAFYEGMLDLNVADVPLHYYYNYEQTLGTAGWDSFAMAANPQIPPENRYSVQDGLWYQLKKNTQLHIIGGASFGSKNRQRHVCFDHDCLEQIFLRVQSRRLRYKLRSRKPLNFLVKDYDERVIELMEAQN
ncbi:glyoxalase-like domain protein [Synechocystis sp. PCC 7338]|uniref:glyoxalase-like domain protein n=1 Tax=Synechocystis sp. PCC 7338 TaxID=2732530 RepID=UPI001BB02A26|nr:glyoxalase-like domain protein [Synechocystis sp. PCC 7338]QUS59477.1 glyoxalase-like domain protein [Synechocystis sp. PCC 7338]